MPGKLRAANHRIQLAMQIGLGALLFVPPIVFEMYIVDGGWILGSFLSLGIAIMLSWGRWW